MESANDMSISKMFAWVEVKRNNQCLPSHYVGKNTEQTKSRHNIENGYEWAQLLNKPGKCTSTVMPLFLRFDNRFKFLSKVYTWLINYVRRSKD